jgi:2-polyprenyl-6-methoxyphenol hydroxylase-like FAD-dependent oxidoreductase
MSDRSVDNAVVVGAGIAGLLAAAALSPRSGTVTILERRRVPIEGGIESLAPQGDFAHALLAGGAQAIERLLPGFLDDLVADDPFVTDIGADVPVYWRAAGTIRREIPWLGTRVPQVGRPLLESRMRARVQSLGNVEIRGEAVVDGIGVADGVVRGVRTRNDMVECDLLVDAAGRTSRSQAWLLDAGVPNVPATIVGVEITYTGLDVARRPDDLEHGAVFAAVQNTPELPRGGVALPAEGPRWTIALGSYFGDKPDLERTSIEAFADSLPDPVIRRLLDHEWLSEPKRYRFPASQCRHFEKARDLPAGFYAMGDSAASFNPIYGQGMSVAALEAVALAENLDKLGNGARLPVALAAATARIIDNPWQIATGADFIYPRTSGKRPPGITTINRYLTEVIAAAAIDRQVNVAFSRVQQLLDRPSSLLRPGLVARVKRLARAAPAAA